MKVINIGGKDYTLKYSIYASLYSECTEKVTTLMARLGETQSKKDIYEFFKGIADVPATAMNMFYAGLLEEHGVHGDKSVPDFNAAISLMGTYFEEHKTDGKGNFYEMLKTLLEVMGEDGFFEMIGLENVLGESKTPKKTPKTPQDHKKTTKKVTKMTPKSTEE